MYQGKDFATSSSQAQITTGVSVFVYQVSVNKVQRTLPPSTPQHRRPLPLDVWLLLTAWAQNVSTEHTLLGWAMRTIDDNPILSSGFLNAAIPGVFLPEETVELAPAELTAPKPFAGTSYWKRARKPTRAPRARCASKAKITLCRMGM